MRDDRALEDALSRPLAPEIDALRMLEGDLLILGVAGKMGPSLARLARRADEAAGGRRQRRVIGVARFSDPAVRAELDRHGVETIQCDLLDREALGRLPDAANVVYMVGQKFGTSGDEPRTWVTNVVAAAYAAERFRNARIVAFSTGNVYPLTPVDGGGPRETDPTGPVGSYAQSALARERIFEFFSARHGTKVALLRLNYAVEPRYGVLRDIADKVAAGATIDLAMGHVNVIWQRDANAIALRCLALASSPPFVLNLTGMPAVSVRSLAEGFGRRLGRAPRFGGREGEMALLSNASCCVEVFGAPATSLEQAMDAIAEWVTAGGASLNKPTHFEEREGRF